MGNEPMSIEIYVKWMSRSVNKTKKSINDPNQPKLIILVQFSKIKKVSLIWEFWKLILLVQFFIFLSLNWNQYNLYIILWYFINLFIYYILLK